MEPTMNDYLCSIIIRQTISDGSPEADTPHAIWQYYARDIAIVRMTLSTITDKTIFLLLTSGIYLLLTGGIYLLVTGDI